MLSMQVVAMTKLRSTIINNSEIMFAHSEHNHPSRGVTVRFSTTYRFFHV